MVTSSETVLSSDAREGSLLAMYHSARAEIWELLATQRVEGSLLHLVRCMSPRAKVTGERIPVAAREARVGFAGSVRQDPACGAAKENCMQQSG